MSEIENIAKQMIVKGKGLLAADESTGTMTKRLSSVNVESTSENRLKFRETLFSAEGMKNYIGGVILYDETIKQKTSSGETIPELIKIIDESKTILWNGPAGYFEIDEFSAGSRKIAEKISENTKNKSLVSIAGGGDTVAAINKFKCSNGFTYLSTAGGAFLELLEGKALPGIKALEINE